MRTAPVGDQADVRSGPPDVDPAQRDREAGIGGTGPLIPCSRMVSVNRHGSGSNRRRQQAAGIPRGGRHDHLQSRHCANRSQGLGVGGAGGQPAARHRVIDGQGAVVLPRRHEPPQLRGVVDQLVGRGVGEVHDHDLGDRQACPRWPHRTRAADRGLGDRGVTRAVVAVLARQSGRRPGGARIRDVLTRTGKPADRFPARDRGAGSAPPASYPPLLGRVGDHRHSRLSIGDGGLTSVRFVRGQPAAPAFPRYGFDCGLGGFIQRQTSAGRTFWYRPTAARNTGTRSAASAWLLLRDCLCPSPEVMPAESGRLTPFGQRWGRRRREASPPPRRAPVVTTSRSLPSTRTPGIPYPRRCADVFDLRRVGGRRHLGVLVVLADEHCQQIPARRHVGGLVERSGVGGAVTEADHRDAIGALVLGRHRQTHPPRGAPPLRCRSTASLPLRDWRAHGAALAAASRRRCSPSSRRRSPRAAPLPIRSLQSAVGGDERSSGRSVTPIPAATASCATASTQRNSPVPMPLLSRSSAAFIRTIKL